MSKFEEIIKKLDMEANAINNPNFISITKESTSVPEYIIDKEEKMGNIQKAEIVLDLGSGNGTAAFTWAHNGYNVIGIEVDPKLYKLSIKAQKNYPELERLRVKFYNGSFYPLGYEKSEKTLKLEKKIIRQYYSRTKEFKPYIVPFADTIYADNNINLKDIDIFYTYAWMFQFPSIFEMFNQYARDDAKLIAIGPGIDKVLTQYPELKREYNTIRKKSV